MTRTSIRIAAIALDGGTQTRAQIDGSVIADYATAIRDGAEFPPIDVYQDGDRYWLADGFHRLKAHEIVGFTEIEATIHRGDRAAAVWHALGSNHSHGLRRTNADKRRAVEIALREFPSRSDRAIAEQVGVTHPTVAAAREDLHPTGKIYQSEIRTGADGRTINTANIGQRPAPGAWPDIPRLPGEGEPGLRHYTADYDAVAVKPESFYHAHDSGIHSPRYYDDRWQANYGRHLTLETVPAVPTVAPASLPHVAQNSGENEWYTPADYIEAARQVLGTIDLDPASSDEANTIVKADRYFTVHDDGLSQPWHGRIWMNPPYATPLIGRFIDRLVDAYRAGDVSAALVLTNNATETQWFQSLASVAVAVCFPLRRVRFWSPRGEAAAPLQGQVVTYLGSDLAAFRAGFGSFGLVARVLR